MKELVDRAVRALFDDGNWYTGVIDQVRVRKKLVHILYDDGDQVSVASPRSTLLY
jgi:hypothetical protein